MSITVREIHGSREGTDSTDRSSTADLAWQLTGSDDTTAMRAALASVVPAIFDGLIFRRLSWEQLGPRIWEFNGHYVHPRRQDQERELPGIGESRFSFDTTGGTLRITSAINQVRYGPSAPNLNGAILVPQVGEPPEGIDIAVPALRFTIEHKKSKASITVAYVKTLARLTASTNDGAFFGFAAGELLFLGARGQQGVNEDPTISYEFVAIENATGLSVGDISGINKAGHEFLHVTYRNDADTALDKKPIGVYVSQVYHPRNFADIGIGTS